MTYIIGIGGFIGLAILWIVIQKLWGKSFPEQITGDEDVLAIRGTCSSCGCNGVCKDNRKQVANKT